MGTGENLGYARVFFDDSDFVSGWLPLPSIATKGTKQWIPIEINSQVACLMDDLCEQGGIVMVLWSATDTPPTWASPDTMGVQFKDGTAVYYDASAKELTVNCKKLKITGDVDIIGNVTVSKDVAVVGEVTAKEVTADEEVTAKNKGIKLTAHKHPTPVGPSGTPIP